MNKSSRSCVIPSPWYRPPEGYEDNVAHDVLELAN